MCYWNLLESVLDLLFLKNLRPNVNYTAKHSSNLFSLTPGRRDNKSSNCGITVALLKFLSALACKCDCRFMVLGWNKLSSDVYLIEISPDSSVPWL